MIYRGGCLVQLQQYDAALADVESAMTSGCLMNRHTKNPLSRAYTIKGILFFLSLARINEPLTYKRVYLLSFFESYYFIGDAYYHLGEFEKSLMFYYRALHKCQSGSEYEDIRYKLIISYTFLITAKNI